MKIRDRARADLTQVLTDIENLPPPLTQTLELVEVVKRMQNKGWRVSLDTILDTARDLGFPVIGSRIYGLDD